MIIMLGKRVHTGTVCDHFFFNLKKVMTHYYQSLLGFSTVYRYLEQVFRTFFNFVLQERFGCEAHLALFRCDGFMVLATFEDKEA
jgi:hypothetical protein